MRPALGVVTYWLLACADAFSASASSSPKNTLYDFPVSNNGGRCRIVIYKVCTKFFVYPWFR